MDKIKITLIGSPIYAEKIKRIIQNTKEISLLGYADDVDEGMRFIDNAHVLLLDIELVNEHVASILENIIRVKSIPVILLADGTVGQKAKTVQAMSTGAVGFMNIKIDQSVDDEQFQKEVITKIIHANDVKIHASAELKHKDEAHLKHQLKDDSVAKSMSSKRRVPIRQPAMIVIGSSTGGPKALHRVLRDLPKDFSTPILIVQHMPSGFTKSLAERLNNISNIRVKEATHGEMIQNGTAYVAPGNYHMKVDQNRKGLKLVLTKEETRLGHRPSINILLESIVHLTNYQKIILILTGMGKDGAEGVKMIKEKEEDAIVIAESEETAVIPGMPNATIMTNYVTEILRIEQIGDALVEYTNTRGY